MNTVHTLVADFVGVAGGFLGGVAIGALLGDAPLNGVVGVDRDADELVDLVGVVFTELCFGLYGA